MSNLSFRYIGQNGWNTIKAQIVKDELCLVVTSVSCGVSDTSAGIVIPKQNAKELAEWLLNQIK